MKMKKEEICPKIKKRKIKKGSDKRDRV